MTRRNTGQAAQTSWDRANKLAAAAGIPPAQARNFLSSYRGTPEAEGIYDYLDGNPTFRDALGKRLISGAQETKVPPRGSRKSRSTPRRTGRTRRPSNGDPTRPVRAGAPNQYLTDKKGIPLECMLAIRELEKQYGEAEVREAISVIDAVREA